MEEKLTGKKDFLHSLQAKWIFLGVIQGGNWEYLGDISGVHFLVAASAVLWRTQAIHSALKDSCSLQ